jgi:hypothetical protein
MAGGTCVVAAGGGVVAGALAWEELQLQKR